MLQLAHARGSEVADLEATEAEDEALKQERNALSEVVELVPAQFVVEEHHRSKYACGRCKETVVTAPGPAKLIEKGLRGPALLANLVVSKYRVHLPLNRLIDIYGCGGLEASSSTLFSWVSAVAREVEPIVERIWEKALASVELQTDGSGEKGPWDYLQGREGCVQGNASITGWG